MAPTSWNGPEPSTGTKAQMVLLVRMMPTMSRMPATERYIIGWTIDFANTSNGALKLNFFFAVIAVLPFLFRKLRQMCPRQDREPCLISIDVWARYA